MIAHPRPSPDDTPDPELVTPRRVAAELLAIATQASRLRIRARGLALYMVPVRETGADPAPTPHGCLTRLCDRLGAAADQATDLATAVRVGQVVLDERYLDPSCRPERPLLDAIEHRPLTRAAAEVAPQIAARGDTDPTWADDNGESWRSAADQVALPTASAADVEQLVGQAMRPPPEHPAAGPAREAARRRKATPGQGKPVDPAEWGDTTKTEALAEGMKAILDRTMAPAPKPARTRTRKAGAK